MSDGRSTIFLLDAQSNEITPLLDTEYALEEHLQELLARCPALLAGGGTAKSARYLLISREMPVPDSAYSGGRWSLDHCSSIRTRFQHSSNASVGRTTRAGVKSSRRCSITRQTAALTGSPVSSGARSNKRAPPSMNLPKTCWQSIWPQIWQTTPLLPLLKRQTSSGPQQTATCTTVASG